MIIILGAFLHFREEQIIEAVAYTVMGYLQ